MSIAMYIKGAPVAQGRPRFSVIKKRSGGQFVNTYDPPKSKAWKQVIQKQLQDQFSTTKIIEKPIVLTLVFHMPRPKSLSKRTVSHVKKPDVDNLAKAVMDAMEGICFKSDSQIIWLIARKQYIKESQEAGVTILIEVRDE